MQETRHNSIAPAEILFVDLDHTLVRTDLLHEALLTLCKQATIKLLRLIILSIAHGRAHFKRAIAEAVTLEVSYLPYRQEVLDFLAERRSNGQKVILATASDSIWAHSIADKLDLFDGILASNGARNLKGKIKLKAIKEYCREHGYSQYEYIGDSLADLPIWLEAQGIYIAAPSNSLKMKVRKYAEPAGILGTRKSPVLSFLSLLRLQHWVKNILIFLPLLAAHKIFELPLAMAALIAFVCFCFCASSAYILNDLADINSDRKHPTKRNRPFASGSIPVIWGLPLAIGLLIFGFTLSTLNLPFTFSCLLGIYFVTTCVYSLIAKRIVMLDVIILAGLYTIRVIAGGAAVSIAVSEWLMALSMFLFVSLAFAKRYVELSRLLKVNEIIASGRGYRVSDIALIESMGPASGYIAVLVLALYVNNPKMQALYSNPWPLWLICPVLMYWVSRVWIKAKRSELSEDPIVFALRDRISRYLCIVIILLLIVSKYL